MQTNADRSAVASPGETSGQTPRFPLDQVVAFVSNILTALGLPRSTATTAATLLLIADARGVESHGIARLPYYAGRFRRGLINTNASLVTIRESASTLALDAQNGFALALAPQAMERCIAKAEASGLCLTTVRASNHFGIAGAYAKVAALRGLGGMAMTNASPLVVPTNGRVAMLGTNPIAFAVPRGPDAGTPPLVIDLATSTVAWGKIEVARRANTPIPLGWALDEDARPTTDPRAARYLTPLGGERLSGGHKGYALATMVDVLCGPLAGASWSLRISGSRGGDIAAGIGHTFMAWRIDAFRDPEEFYAAVDDMADQLRLTPPVGRDGSGEQPVIFPGDPELAAEETSASLGIPIRLEVLTELRELADAVGVTWIL